MLTDHDKAIRERRIGASEVAAVLGLESFADATEFATWARLTQGYKRPDAPELTAGNYLEPSCVAYYLDRHEGATVIPCAGMVHREHDWLSATPDRRVNLQGGTWLLEAKISRDRKEWGEPGTDQVPVYYAAQAQAQMAVTRDYRVDFCVFFTQTYEFSIFRLDRDDAVIAHIIAACSAWFNRHVVKGEMPALDGGNAAAAYLRKRYPGGAPLAVATEAQRAMVAEYIFLKNAIKRDTKAADKLKQEIALELGDANGWEGLCTYKPNVKGVRSLRLAGEKE